MGYGCTNMEQARSRSGATGFRKVWAMREKVGFDIVPPDVMAMMGILSDAGHGVWLVGGALRDHFLGQAPRDFDLATDASADEVVRLFPRVIPIGIRHGTVQVHTRTRDVEVTSTPGSGLEGILEDLGRRDFTINALALSYPEGSFLDPHGGCNDADARILRAVGDAGRRFREDPLRVLRVFRFVSELGLDVEPGTCAAARSEANGLAAVAGERVREEVFRILSGGNAVSALRLMEESRVLRTVLPELHESGCSHAIDTMGRCPNRLRIRMAALLHGLVEEEASLGAVSPCGRCVSSRRAEEVMVRWRLSRRQIQGVLGILENPLPGDSANWTDADLRRFIARTGPEFAGDVLELARACRAAGGDSAGAEQLSGLYRRYRGEVELRPVPRLRDLPITGEDVMRITGLKPGPRVGKILERAHLEVIENPFMNERKILMDFIRKEFHKEAEIETS